MPDLRRKGLGQWGENVAAQYLEERGCTILTQNWRCPSGEVDLVILDPKSDMVPDDQAWLAFVEVRTRRGTRYGSAADSITAHKLAHMIDVAQTYVMEHDWDGPWRLDVVAIQVKRDQPPEIEWYKNVSA